MGCRDLLQIVNQFMVGFVMGPIVLLGLGLAVLFYREKMRRWDK